MDRKAAWPEASALTSTNLRRKSALSVVAASAGRSPHRWRRAAYEWHSIAPVVAWISLFCPMVAVWTDMRWGEKLQDGMRRTDYNFALSVGGIGS